MTKTNLYPSWKEHITYDKDGPTHTQLIESDGFRAVLVGVEAGGKIPPHASTAAAYHFLEGSGWMIVDGERLAVAPGSTVVVPNGAFRGVESETQLSFLGTQSAKEEPEKKGFMKSGLMIALGLLMGAVMVVVMMFTGIGSQLPGGMLGIMAFPAVGFLVMLVLMFFMGRWMTGGSNPMTQTKRHKQMMQAQSQKNEMTTLTYKIPSVSCGHCKMTIEGKVGELPGVHAISVDVKTQEAIVKFSLPATKNAIESRLAEIGYSPESI